MSVCAVIPAAGRGTRLGLDRPKILARIDDGLTILDVLCDLLSDIAEHLCVVVSARALAPVRAAVGRHSAERRISLCVQEEPTGMGDAIFCGHSTWCRFDDILVVWGDQVLLSRDTLRSALRLHGSYDGPHLTLPLAHAASPYVEYDFDAGQRLSGVRQRREGDLMNEQGWSDAGLFLFSTGGLERAWNEYRASAARGSITGEVNFLPFMPYLSQQRNWAVLTFRIGDAMEARGINTMEDLRFAQRRFAERLLGAR